MAAGKARTDEEDNPLADHLGQWSYGLGSEYHREAAETEEYFGDIDDGRDGQDGHGIRVVPFPDREKVRTENPEQRKARSRTVWSGRKRRSEFTS